MFWAQQLSETLTVLKAQNDELTGHTNPKQKIHLHQKIKEENNVLRTRLRELEGQLSWTQKQLRTLEGDATGKGGAAESLDERYACCPLTEALSLGSSLHGFTVIKNSKHTS